MYRNLFISLNSDGISSIRTLDFEAWLSEQEGVKVLSCESPHSATIAVREDCYDQFVEAAAKTCSIRKFRSVSLL